MILNVNKYNKLAILKFIKKVIIDSNIVNSNFYNFFELFVSYFKSEKFNIYLNLIFNFNYLLIF